MTVKQQELSKAELLRRLDHRSRSRYNEPFSESMFDDLQKDDLIPALERSGNEGLSPTYFATYRHYRRALQLQRLRSVGIKGRDALRVQLFVRGYGLKVSEARGAVPTNFCVASGSSARNFDRNIFGGATVNQVQGTSLLWNDNSEASTPVSNQPG